MHSTSFMEHQPASEETNERAMVVHRHIIVIGVPFPEPDIKLHR